MGLAMALRSLWRPRAQASESETDDYWYEEVGSGTTSGVRVSPDIALKAAAVYACVKVLAETIATLPLRMRADGLNGAEDAPDHPLDELIRYQPNATQTAVEFWETMLLHAALRGVGYAEIISGPRGAVDQLLPLHADRVSPERLRDGTLRFRVTSPRTGQQRVLLQEEIFRIPGMSSDGVTGLRAVDLAADDIGLGMAADEYAARVFSNRLNIGGFLVHPGKISKEAQRRLVHSLMERFAGTRNAHRPAVLQEGITFQRATMDASDAQLLEARKWQITLIAMRWRIPLHMLGIYDGATHSNVEQQALDLVKYTLRPWVKRIEQAIRRDLVIAKGRYWAEFNLDALLRGDSKTQHENAARALGAGGHHPYMTVNEIRTQFFGLPRLDGHDTLSPPINALRANVATESEERARDDASPAERLVRKENAAIRKAMRRFAGDADAFRTWVAAFYGGHVSAAMAALSISQDQARAYCARQRDELLQANDVEGLLERRAMAQPDRTRGLA